MDGTERGHWSRRLGFILAASGSAIGLGNLWRFPTVAGENGGAAFVLVYFVCVVAVALPILLAELRLGQWAQRNPVGAYRRVRDTLWSLGLGRLAILTSLMILAYYSVVASWCVGYVFKALAGSFENVESREQVEAIFASMLGDPLQALALLLGFVLLTRAAVSGGVREGIERWSRILMPTLLAILVILVVRSLTLPGARSGLSFFLEPDFSRIGAHTFLAALGQAFFSIGVGMGIMITYGSYLTESQDPASSAGWICGADTAIALLAGLAIFPALFTIPGLTPEEGPKLLFVVLPNVFDEIPGGSLFGAGFFVLLTLAAVTSAISLMEVPVAYLIDEHGWERPKAVRWITALTFLIGAPVALSSGAVRVLTDLPGIHRSALDLMDIAFGKACVCLGALGSAVTVGWLWTEGRSIAEQRSVWRLVLRYLCPAAILLLLLTGWFEWR